MYNIQVTKVEINQIISIDVQSTRRESFIKLFNKNWLNLLQGCKSLSL